MNEFHSYRRARAGRHRPLVLRRDLPGARRRVLPHPGRPARAVPAPRREEPAARRCRCRRRAAPSSTATARSSPRTCPGYTVKLLAPSRGLAARRAARGSATVVPLDTRRRRRQSCAGTARRRYQPALVFGNATFETVAPARGAPRRAARTRDPVGAAGGSIPTARRWRTSWGTSARSPNGTWTAERFPGRAARGRSSGAPAWSSEYDDALRGRRGRALRRGERARAPGARGGRARPSLAAHRRASRSTPPSTSTCSGTSTASGRRGAGRGAMVAMTPDGRDLRALLARPRYDPNAVRRRHLQRPTGGALNDDPASPLLNRAIQTRYPPASPFKLATAAMALKRGHRRPSTPTCRSRAAAGCRSATGTSAAGRRRATARST